MMASCGSDVREPSTGAAVLASGLVVTDDDGRSFRRASLPRIADRSQAAVVVTSPGHLLALAEVSGRIWRSTNSGSTWVDQHVVGRVLELAGRDGGAWAIASLCSGAKACKLRLLSSFDEGRHWTAVTPPVGSRFDRGSTSGALRLSFASAQFGVATMSGGTLAVTSDGGHTWTYRRSPCRDGQSIGGAGPNADLWIGCASQPGAGNQAKTLYRSNDSGRSFDRVGPADPRDDNGRGLPGSGYLESLVVTDSRSAYATLERAGVAYTRDGGLRWTLAPNLAQGDLTGYGPPTTIDRRTSWEPIYQAGIYRTTDAGRHWKHVSVGPR
jgi:photosystem II stability/assembly factor-like uncharacterized protein